MPCCIIIQNPEPEPIGNYGAVCALCFYSLQFFLLFNARSSCVATVSHADEDDDVHFAPN